MELPQALHNLGALFVLAIGLLGLVRPETLAGHMSLAPQGAFGRSEVRSGIGAFWCGLAVFAFWSQDALAFAAIGAAFAFAACARWVEIARGDRESDIWAGVILDAGIAVLLLYPQGS